MAAIIDVLRSMLMMRAPIIAWVACLVVLAGCDKLLGLEQIPPPPPDAPYVICSAQTTPSFFCADFDEPVAQAYVDGLSVALPAANPGATAVPMPPAVSPPNGLWIDALSTTYVVQANPPAQTVTTLHATFELQVTSAATYKFEVIQLGINDAMNQCAATVQVDGGGPTINVFSECNNTRSTETIVVPGIPTGWTHYALDLDTQAQNVTLTDLDTPMFTATVAFTSAAGQTPAAVQAGVLYQRNTGPIIGLDDIVVTTTP